MKSWNEMSKREQDECTLWDIYKDAYGIRPRHLNMATMTDVELASMIEQCGVDLQRNEEIRMEEEKRQSAVFEERVAMLLQSGARDRAQALRWIHEAEDTQGDDEYLCYTLGLPYGYFKEVA